MTPEHEQEQAPAAAAGPGRRPPSAWYVAAPAIALVIGLVLGGVVVGAAGGGDGALDDLGPDETSSAGLEPSGEADDLEDPTGSASDEPGTAVVVPDACLEAAESAEQAVQAIEDGVDAIREFRAEAVIDLLNRLEDIDAQVREQVAACREARLTDAALEPSPTASP